MADKHGLTVDLSIEKGIPNTAEDIKILIFESVRELLFNAVKHANIHAATVNLRIIDGNSLQIVVYNAGQGFDPTALKPAGTEGGGFGLFSIRERLALIGGKLDIVSAPGEGSRFTLVVPLGESAAAPPAPASMAVPPGQISDQSISMIIRKPGAEIRVMLVDDHAVMRQGLTRLLEAVPDIEVVGEAADGLEAVELARELAPDVVLMDLSLPKVNGIDATRMIHAARPEIRIIGLSMFEEPQQAQAMIDAGAVAYLTKSGPDESLIAAIRNCIAGT
jgi:CheY-like chemotaxis protein